MSNSCHVITRRIFGRAPREQSEPDRCWSDVTPPAPRIIRYRRIRHNNRIAVAIMCLKLPPTLEGKGWVGGGLSYSIGGFHRFKTPVKGCRISKSDLQFCNGCQMLKQVQHDKFYGKTASPLEGEAAVV